MEQNDDKVPHLLELQEEIKTNSEKWSLDTIHETRQSFYFILRQLNVAHNFRIGINKISLDILYDIFILAVYNSSEPVKATLNISHVCQRWRKSALGWPILWAFITSSYGPSILDLFMKRSQDVSLTFFCTPGIFLFPRMPSTSYLITHLDSILSRLYSLIVTTESLNLASFNRVLKNSKSPPLKVQHLTVRCKSQCRRSVTDGKDAPILTCGIDNSCLRTIRLEGANLPTFENPHNNLLTHFTLKSTTPPPLSQLLAFLSGCPSLKVLELGLQDLHPYDRFRSIYSGMKESTDAEPLIDTQLNFVNLTRLELGACGPSSLDFIRRVSGFVPTLRALSQFLLYYNVNPEDSRGGAHLDLEDQQGEMKITPVSSSAPFQIIEAFRPGLYPSLSNYQYLGIYLNLPKSFFRIHGDISADHLHRELDGPCPLVIDLDHLEIVNILPIRALVQAMPQIQHLKLGCDAWRILSLWPNVQDAFPCLQTLELLDFVTFDMNSLPDDLQFKKLIIRESCKVSSESILYLLVTRDVEVLKVDTVDSLRYRRSMSWDRYDEIRAAFLERGVEIGRSYPPHIG